MSDPEHRLARRLDDDLVGLSRLLAHPPVIAHRVRPASRFVATTAGVFVLALEADGADDTATATRLALADHLSWVPFVDAFVVVDEGAGPVVPALLDRRRRDQRAAAPLLPVDLVPRLLTEGHAVDLATLKRIGRVLAAGRLVPGWIAGLPESPSGATAEDHTTPARPPLVDLTDGGTDVTHA